MKKEIEHGLIGHSSLLVTAMSAGGLIAVPGTCEISLIRKVLPGESMEKSGQDLRSVIQNMEIIEGASIEIEFSASRDHEFGGTPFECDITGELKNCKKLLTHIIQELLYLREHRIGLKHRLSLGH